MHNTVGQLRSWKGWIGGGVALAAAGILVGCEGVTGPCVHTYREPLLQIVSARDAETGAPITNVVIRNVRREGIAQDLQLLLAGPAYSVEVQGDSLLCRVPCGFATSEGNYIFTVSAPGYPPQDRGYEARYRVFKGGCPSYNDGGLRVSLALHGS
jgi:hypothetical protein